MKKYTLSDLNINLYDVNLYNEFLIIIKNNQMITKDLFVNVYTKLNINYNLNKTVQSNDLSQISNVEKYEKTLSIAKKLYMEAINDFNEVKLVVALYVAYYLKQDISFFSTVIPPSILKDKIENFLKNIFLNFSVTDEAPVHEKSMITKYKNAKNQKIYIEILKAMNQLKENSSVFQNINSTWGLLYRYIFIIDKNYIVDYLETTTYENTEMIFFSLRSNIHEVLEIYDYSKNNYPFLRGLNYLFHYYEEVFKKDNILNFLNSLDDFLLKNIDLVSSVLDALYIKHLCTFNYYMGICIARNIQMLSFYLRNSDFSRNSLYYFSQGFMSIPIQEKDFLSCFSKIFDTILENKCLNQINEDIGCLDMVMKYYDIQKLSKEDYLKILKRYSDEIKVLQNSWSQTNLTKVWCKLFYCAVSNHKVAYQYDDKELRRDVSVLYDKSNELFYDSQVIDMIKRMLLNPTEVTTVELSDSQQKIQYKLY